MNSNNFFNDALCECLVNSNKLKTEKGQLMLDKVVLENFKSYAGRHVLGPFHTRFSCIIGPNGSGKSNIIDAVLFVFGRRAYTFRHKKLVDLIHNSFHCRNATFAKVDIHLQMVFRDGSGKNDQVIPNSQFTMSREIQNDGSSKYMLNDKILLYKEFVEFLKPYGLDLHHNRFLISQGEVEQIAMLKPKGHGSDSQGLLEYLEDIIGSSQYIVEILSLQEQLQKITEQVQFKRDSMSAVQGHFLGMEGSISEARQICRVERKVITLRSYSEQKNLLRIKSRIANVEASQENLKKEWEKWCSSRAEKKQKIHEMNLSVQHQDEIVCRAETMLSETENEFSSLERLDNELAAKQTHCVKRIKVLQKDISSLEEEKEDNERKIQEFEKKNEEMKQKIPKEREVVENLERCVEAIDQELEGDYAVLRRSKEKAYELLKPEKVKLGELEASLEVYQGELKLIEEKRLEALKNIEKLTTELNSSEKLKDSKQDELKKTESLLTKMKNAYEKKQTEIAEFRDKLKKEREELHVICGQLDSKEAELLDSRHKTMLIPSILRAKHSGILHGIINRLWNLCEIDPKYQTAVMAVAGSEYILVEETKDAEEVVSFVRQKKLGRITCIVMSHIRRTLMPQLLHLKKICLPKDTQLLLNHIRVIDPEYEIAFYFVLRDVLVAENLDIARQVAFGEKRRWKVVTYDGSIIDKSGVMSGGRSKALSVSDKQSLFVHQQASQAPSQFMDSLASQKQIETLRTQIREIKARITSLENGKNQVESELTRIEENISRLRACRSRLLMKSEAVVKEVEFYKGALKEHPLPELSSQEKQRVEELLHQIKLCEEKRAQQMLIVEEKQQDVDRVTQDIELIGSGRRKQALDAFLFKKKDLEQWIAQMDAHELHLGRLRTRNITLTQLLPEAMKDMKNQKTKEQQLINERNALTDQAEQVLRKKEELEKIVAEQKEIAVLQHDKLKALLNDCKQDDLQEVNYETRLHEVKQSLEALQHARLKGEKKLTGLIDEWKAVPIIDDTQFNLLLQKNKKECLPMKEEAEPESELVLNLSEEELGKYDELDLVCQIKHLTDSVLKNKIDLSVIERFQELSEKFRNKQADYETVCAERDTLAKQLETKQLMRLQMFTQGFIQIAKHVKEIYQMLTHEGDAELELADPSSPFSHGVIFSVRPPKKSWKRIQNLSGGEKTLSSLALVFALQNFNPTPIYFLDEIDAALDHANVSTIAFYIASQATNAQFIIISLRNHMFELANRLFGIYKIQGATHFTHIDPDAIINEISNSSCRVLP